MEFVLLYFSNKVCGACEAIRSKVERILKSYSKVKSMELDGVFYPAIIQTAVLSIGVLFGAQLGAKLSKKYME